MVGGRPVMAGSKTENGTMDSEAEITLGLLTAVHEDSGLTQRSAARNLGIALGLTNAYLKRCIRKGYIKVRQIPSNRYAYYLTPQGFAEKARLTTEYLSHSFTFFRQAREQCADALTTCAANDWKNVALAGSGDLAEIAVLCGHNLDDAVTLHCVVDTEDAGAQCAGLPLVHTPPPRGKIDAVILTDLRMPQQTFDALRDHFPADRILTPPLLQVVRDPAPDAEA